LISPKTALSVLRYPPKTLQFSRALASCRARWEGDRSGAYPGRVSGRDRPSPGSVLRRQSSTSASFSESTAVDEAGRLPAWAKPSVMRWLAPVAMATNHRSAYRPVSAQSVSLDFVELAERRLHIVVQRYRRTDAVIDGLMQVLEADDELLFRALELALEHIDLGYRWQEQEAAIADLNRILTESGSNWEVVVDRIKVDERRYRDERRLQRRSPISATEAITSLADSTKRAGEHLSLARTSAFGREPQPDRAYWEAVKAVEAATIPVVLPDAKKPRLGQVIGELRNAPEKWTFVLEEDVPGLFGNKPVRDLSSVESVIVMLDLLWRNHIDRHAVGDDQPARPVSQE